MRRYCASENMSHLTKCFFYKNLFLSPDGSLYFSWVEWKIFLDKSSESKYEINKIKKGLKVNIEWVSWFLLMLRLTMWLQQTSECESYVQPHLSLSFNKTFFKTFDTNFLTISFGQPLTKFRLSLLASLRGRKSSFLHFPIRL